MTAARELERRYRRLLALYPAGHRAEHEEEMLGVLMTSAPAGQRRPRPAESAALVRGAVSIWLRPGRGSAFQRWQDGLATVSVLLPLVLTTYWTMGQLSQFHLLTQEPPVYHRVAFAYACSDVLTTGPWLVVAVLVLFRRRWTAVVVAAGALAAIILSNATEFNLSFLSPASMLYVAGLGLEITALVASAGPARGRAILGWKHYAGAGVVTVAISRVDDRLWLHHQAAADAFIIIVATAALALLAASSPYGRRSAVLLLIPGYYLALGLLAKVPYPAGVGQPNNTMNGWEGLPRITLTCAPLAAAAALAVIMAVRYLRRPQPATPQ